MIASCLGAALEPLPSHQSALAPLGGLRLCRKHAQIVPINHMWTEIVNQVAALSPGVLASVNRSPPQRRLTPWNAGSVPLPDRFKQYLTVMDGQNDLGRDHPLIGFNRFPPIAHIIETMATCSASISATRIRIEWMTENDDSVGDVGQPLGAVLRFRGQPTPDSPICILDVIWNLRTSLAGLARSRSGRPTER